MRSVFCCLLIYWTALSFVNAQTDPNLLPCATPPENAWADWYHANKHRLAQSRHEDTTWLYVPVTLHLIANDEGNGQYGFGAALADLCQLNYQFEPARIRFYLHPDDFLRTYNNTVWYSHNFSEASEMIDKTRLPNRCNVYVVSGASSNCGYSWRDVVVMAKSCSGPKTTTWAHEIGHHLSLPHTFRGWEGKKADANKRAPETVNSVPVEKVDNSNCATAGDRFCDTAPDYLSDRWRCDPQGRSIMRQMDPDSVPFFSDGSLYMSYAFDACSNRFSPEQVAAMRANLRTEHIAYTQQPVPAFSMPGSPIVELVSPIDSQEVQYNAVKLQWKAVPGARFYLVRLSWDTRFTTLFANDLVRDTVFTVTRPVPNNRLLYWDVQAFDEVNLCLSAQPKIGVLRTRNILPSVQVNELAEKTHIQWLPNPAVAGQPVQLEVQTEKAFAAELTLRDAAGRLHQRQQVQCAAGDNHLSVETTTLPHGLYFLTLQNAQGHVVKRIVVHPAP